MNARTGTANERIGQQAVDLAEARKTRDWYIEKYLAILEQRNGLLDALRGMLLAYEGDAGDTDSPACITARRAIEKAGK